MLDSDMSLGALEPWNHTTEYVSLVVLVRRALPRRQAVMVLLYSLGDHIWSWKPIILSSFIVRIFRLQRSLKVMFVLTSASGMRFV